MIVEAAQPSGTLITADRALRLGRNVGAVPGQVGVRVAAGPNDLIRDGAYLIRDARDVLDLAATASARSRAGPRHGGRARRSTRPLRALLERVAVRGGDGRPDGARGAGSSRARPRWAWRGSSCSGYVARRRRSAATRPRNWRRR